MLGKFYITKNLGLGSGPDLDSSKSLDPDPDYVNDRIHYVVDLKYTSFADRSYLEEFNLKLLIKSVRTRTARPVPLTSSNGMPSGFMSSLFVSGTQSTP
jgi:hypothetical protein